MTVAGKNPSLKWKMFITSEKLKVPGTGEECKRKENHTTFEFSATKEVTGPSSQDMVKEEGNKRRVKEFALRVVLLVSV